MKPTRLATAWAHEPSSRSASGALMAIESKIALRRCTPRSWVLATVGLRDDFFELGGHSLLAVRLLARIEREFKKAIPLPALFQSPTIEHLATFLRDDGESARSESSAIVPLNEGGEGPAFYCVHSVGGEVMSFRHLANHLGPEQRFMVSRHRPSCEPRSSPRRSNRWHVTTWMSSFTSSPKVLTCSGAGPPVQRSPWRWHIN